MVIEDIGTSKNYIEGWYSYYNKGLDHLYRLGSNEDYKKGFNDARLNHHYLKELRIKAQLLKTKK